MIFSDCSKEIVMLLARHWWYSTSTDPWHVEYEGKMVPQRYVETWIQRRHVLDTEADMHVCKNNNGSKPPTLEYTRNDYLNKQRSVPRLYPTTMARVCRDRCLHA